jgi:hypothetical protein
MRTISLLEGARIWTTEGIVAVEDVVGRRRVYSPFGEIGSFTVQKAGIEEVVLCHMDDGNRAMFGIEHTFMGRDFKSPELKPIAIRDLVDQNEMAMVLMPTRKHTLGEGMNDLREEMMMALDSHPGDELPIGMRSKLFLRFNDQEGMNDFMIGGGLFGMRVRLNMEERIIELDEGRPTCFPTKMLLGGNVKEMVNSLIDKHVLRPVLPYNEFLRKAEHTGCFFEGVDVASMRTVLGVINTPGRAEAYHVILDDPQTTIELPFMRT